MRRWRPQAAALAAQQATERALEEEHRLRARVAELEARVGAVRGRPDTPPCAAQARHLLDGLHEWLARTATPLPDALREAAAALEQAAAPEAEEAEGAPAERSPTQPADTDEDLDGGSDSDEAEDALAAAQALALRRPAGDAEMPAATRPRLPRRPPPQAGDPLRSTP